MSPDPLGGQTIDPQTLNKYSYVRNNPVNLTDPTGMYTCGDDTADNEPCSSPDDKRFEEARLLASRSGDLAVVAAASTYGGRNQDNGVIVNFKSSDAMDGSLGDTRPVRTMSGGQITHIRIESTFSKSLGGESARKPNRT